MKSTKSTKEEECGIWLDTKELKQKKQQTRPVSGLRKPLARAGFSVYHLSFTQTKLNMPVTRQSTISSFFTPRSTDLNRSAAPAGTTHTGAKRKHHMTIESSSRTPEEDLQDWDGDWEGSPGKDEKERRFFHLICGEEDEPPEKRRHVAHHTEQEQYPNQTDPETQPFLHGASQEVSPGPKDEDKHVPREQKLTVLTSRPVNEHHRRSSAIKTKASPVKRMGKENTCPTSSIQSAHSSPFKRRLVSSPAKCRLKERHTRSPIKHTSAETAGETLDSFLFTQDSEGFCVIAHRDQRPSSEVKGHSTALVTEDEDEDMLFTQDSEGNMVIKH